MIPTNHIFVRPQNQRRRQEPSLKEFMVNTPAFTSTPKRWACKYDDETYDDFDPAEPTGHARRFDRSDDHSGQHADLFTSLVTSLVTTLNTMSGHLAFLRLMCQPLTVITSPSWASFRALILLMLTLCGVSSWRRSLHMRRRIPTGS